MSLDNLLDSKPSTLLTLALVGATVGLGKLLASKEPFSWRLVIGRTILAAGLGTAAGLISIVVPGVSIIGLCGGASAAAMLGAAGIERIINKYVVKE